MQKIHQLPGRMRIRLSEEEAVFRVPSEIEARLRQLPQIKSVNFQPITRSLLIYYEDLTARGLWSELVRIFQPEKASLIHTCKNIIHSLVVAVLAERQLRKKGTGLLSGLLLATSFVENFCLNPAIFTSGFKQLIKLKPSADSLTLVSILAAYLIKQPITGTTVMGMSSLSNALGDWTNQRSRSSLRYSISNQEKQVNVKQDAAVKQIPLKDVQLNDHVIFYTGEKILVDGRIYSGEALIDEASITGEFANKHKEKADSVYASSVVVSGQIEVIAEKIGKETEEAAIYQLLEEAEKNESQLQKTADRLANKMVPLSFASASVTYLLTRDFVKSLGVLVIDFVCGIKLSSEVAVLSTMNHFTQKEVVVKGGQAIENAADVKEIVFDKTGTLTTGQPTVIKIVPRADHKKEDILRAAAYAEQHSYHPLAFAIMQEAKKRKIPFPDLALEDEKVVTGSGVIAANYYGKEVIVGSKEFLLEQLDSVSDSFKQEETINKGVYLCVDHEPIGVIVINDMIRENMKETIQQLKKSGIKRTTILTGDQFKPAQEVADELAIDHIASQMLPKEKVAYIKEAAKKYPVMMVGDGINDSAALKWSQLGVTLGNRVSEAAQNSSDIMIQNDQPELLSEIVAQSQKTMQIIGQNYRWVFLLNTLAIGLSLTGRISPIVSAFIHNATTLGVIGRSYLKLR